MFLPGCKVNDTVDTAVEDIVDQFPANNHRFVFSELTTSGCVKWIIRRHRILSDGS